MTGNYRAVIVFDGDERVPESFSSEYAAKQYIEKALQKIGVEPSDKWMYTDDGFQIETDVDIVAGRVKEIVGYDNSDRAIEARQNDLRQLDLNIRWRT